MDSLRTRAGTKLKYLCIICCWNWLKQIIYRNRFPCLHFPASRGLSLCLVMRDVCLNREIALYKHERVGRILHNVNPMSVNITCYTNIAIAFITFMRKNAKLFVMALTKLKEKFFPVTAVTKSCTQSPFVAILGWNWWKMDWNEGSMDVKSWNFLICTFLALN